ncbi:MAG TPA: PAS domain S-box protein, partial [Bacteroidales bacterium]|nr:PAS domain S-box protein [Bacteroidales bacterium]
MQEERPSYEELEQMLKESQAALEAFTAKNKAARDDQGNISSESAILTSLQSESFLASRLHAALNAISDHIWIVDKDYRILWANRHNNEEFPCCRLNRDEEPCFLQIHGTLQPITGCPVERAKRSLKRELFMLEENGKYYEISADPIINSLGQFDGCVHILRDVTTARKAQLAREKTDNLFQWLAEKASDVIFRYEIKPNRGFTYVSPAATIITSYSPEEYYADSELMIKIIHPDDRQLVIDYFDNRNNFENPLEIRWIQKNGTTFWIELRSIAIYDESGDLIAIEGIIRDISSRKTQELEQTEIERKLQAIIANIDGFVYRCRFDKDWTMEYISDACQSLTGYAPDELINNKVISFNEIIHPDYRQYCWQLWQDAMNQQHTVELEYPIVTKSGEMRWVWERGCGVHDKDGNLVALEGFITDITDRRRSDLELRKLSQAVEQSPVSVVITNTEGNIEYVNEKFTQLTGYAKDETIGQNPRILQSGVQSKLFYQKMWETISSGEVWTGEFCNKKKNGELYWEWASISPMRNQQGEISHYIAIKEDITETKKTNTGHKILYNLSILWEEEINLDRFFEVVRQELGQLYDINNFFAARYDSETDTLKKWIFHDENDSFSSWSAKASISGHVAKWNKPILLRGNEIAAFVAQYQLHAVGTLPQCWLGVPIVVSKSVYGVIVLQDYQNTQAYTQADKDLLGLIAREIGIFIEKQQYVNELLKAKQKAEESDRLKSAFLANMSHEIRTPMNGILGFSELLKAPDLSSDEREEYIALINKSGERMLNILNDIIDISRIEAGVVELYPVETNINELIEFIFNFFRPQASQKGLTLLLKNTLRPEQAILNIDKEKLYAILANLVKNAVKYTHQGHIEIGCEHKGDDIEFFVSDTGIGIPKDRQSAIFERFIQADIEDRMAYQGAGLGLSITVAYVEMLGG